MIRLTVIGADEERWRQVTGRLRFAEIVSFEPALLLRQTADAFDAAVIVNPNAFDWEAIAVLLERKRHVLLATPERLTIDALEQWEQLAQQSSVHLAIRNPDRYLPSRNLVHQRVLAGHLGEPGLLRIHRWETAAQSPGSRPLSAPLARDLDLAWWYLGVAPNSVFALRTHQEGTEHVQVHLGYASGAMALLSYCSGLPGHQPFHALSLIGSAGAGYADDQANMQLLFAGDQPQALKVDEGVLHWANLLDGFAQELNPEIGIADDHDHWRTLLHLQIAIESSIASHAAVRWEVP